MSSSANPLISIIVPSYNVEAFLDRCVESIVNQTYRNLEIILVDDGAKDRTGEICDQWQERDDRIHTIHKANAGLGFARNTGLDYCKGDYISFIDSDDFVDLNMYQRMVDAMTEAGADTCYCSYNIYSNQEKAIVEKSVIRSGIFTGREVLLDIVGAPPEFPNDCLKQMAVWACLFSGEIIRKNNLRFKSEREYLSEDLPFDVQYLPYAEKVVIIEDCFYNYCINAASLTHKYYPDRLSKEKFLYHSVCEELDTIYPNKEYQLRYNRLFLGRVRTCIVQEVQTSGLSKKSILNNIRKIVEDQTVHNVVCTYPIMRGPLKQRIFNFALKYRMANIMYILVSLKK